MIKEFKVKNLNNKKGIIHLFFNNDINILTGRNGSGKTTIMKTIWYLISGNIERVPREIKFDEIELLTKSYFLIITRISDEIFSFEAYEDSSKIKMLYQNKNMDMFKKDKDIDDLNHITCKIMDTSVFFPTFRRIEGGFSIEKTDPRLQIQQSLHDHADRLSVYKHKFISSISTEDIKTLITDKNNEASEAIDKASRLLSLQITRSINKYKPDSIDKEQELIVANDLINKIKTDVASFELHREELFQSIDILSKQIKNIFSYDGIKISDRLVLGKDLNPINSDIL